MKRESDYCWISMKVKEPTREDGVVILFHEGEVFSVEVFPFDIEAHGKILYWKRLKKYREIYKRKTYRELVRLMERKKCCE